MRIDRMPKTISRGLTPVCFTIYWQPILGTHEKPLPIGTKTAGQIWKWARSCIQTLYRIVESFTTRLFSAAVCRGQNQRIQQPRREGYALGVLKATPSIRLHHQNFRNTAGPLVTLIGTDTPSIVAELPECSTDL